MIVGSAAGDRYARTPWRCAPVQCGGVLVADLGHFLGLPEDASGSARRLAQELGDIVRAGTAGEVGDRWVSALLSTPTGPPALPRADDHHHRVGRGVSADPMVVHRL